MCCPALYSFGRCAIGKFAVRKQLAVGRGTRDHCAGSTVQDYLGGRPKPNSRRLVGRMSLEWLRGALHNRIWSSVLCIRGSGTRTATERTPAETRLVEGPLGSRRHPGSTQFITDAPPSVICFRSQTRAAPTEMIPYFLLKTC